MAVESLEPQDFSATPENPNAAVTQLPEIDFYQFAIDQLPDIYGSAANFLRFIKVIADQKEKLYNIIRSLVNVYNLNDTGNTSPTTTVSGVPSSGTIKTPLPYLKMLASNFSVSYPNGADDATIIKAVKNSINFVNSRGLPKDFYNYFVINGVTPLFTNANIQESGNATISFSLPIQPTVTAPNPVTIFLTDMTKIKGAGIKVNLFSLGVPLFQYAKLPTDSGPTVAPGNAGFGILQFNNQVVNGGYWSDQIPPP